jgi:hypothetical protein
MKGWWHSIQLDYRDVLSGTLCGGKALKQNTSPFRQFAVHRMMPSMGSTVVHLSVGQASLFIVMVLISWALWFLDGRLQVLNSLRLLLPWNASSDTADAIPPTVLPDGENPLGSSAVHHTIDDARYSPTGVITSGHRSSKSTSGESVTSSPESLPASMSSPSVLDTRAQRIQWCIAELEAMSNDHDAGPVVCIDLVAVHCALPFSASRAHRVRHTAP